MPLEQDVLDIGKQLEKLVGDGNPVSFLCFISGQISNKWWAG